MLFSDLKMAIKAAAMLNKYKTDKWGEPSPTVHSAFHCWELGVHTVGKWPQTEAEFNLSMLNNKPGINEDPSDL